MFFFFFLYRLLLGAFSKVSFTETDGVDFFENSRFLDRLTVSK